MIDKVKQGKKNRAQGAQFERKVRADLESKGWIVDRWTNNVELYRRQPEKVSIRLQVNDNPTKERFATALESNRGRIIKAKSFMGKSRTNGFPDFVCFKITGGPKLYRVHAIECKSNGYLDKTEKAKCRWLLDNNIFSKIFIASKDGTKIKYKEFEK